MTSRSPLKAKPLRNPGQSLDEAMDDLWLSKGLFYYFLPGFMLLIAALEWLAYLGHVPRQPWTFTIAAAVLAVWGVIRFVQLRRKYQRLMLGRDGEKVVGQFLEGLRVDGARIFHDVPADGFNLDHVVISSRGIYAIETKTRSKVGMQPTVHFDGERIAVAGIEPDRDAVAQSRGQVSWLMRLLKESTGKEFRVRGVVVFPGWFVERAASAKGSALWVLEPKELPGWLEQEPEVLAASDVSLAAFHLSRYIRTT